MTIHNRCFDRDTIRRRPQDPKVRERPANAEAATVVKGEAAHELEPDDRLR